MKHLKDLWSKNIEGGANNLDATGTSAYSIDATAHFDLSYLAFHPLEVMSENCYVHLLNQIH